MLPSGGWLADANITGGIPFEGVLPEEYLGVYSEGGNGVIIGSTELDFEQIHLIFELSFLRERFGYGESADSTDLTTIFTIEMVQAAVFGVLLLDSFTPPRIAAEFFEFVGPLNVACVNGLVGEEVAFGPCADSEPILLAEVSGIEVLAAESTGINTDATEVQGVNTVTTEVEGTSTTYSE